MHSCSGTSMRHVPWIPLLRQRSRKVCVAVLYQMTPSHYNVFIAFDAAIHQAFFSTDGQVGWFD